MAENEPDASSRTSKGDPNCTKATRGIHIRGRTSSESGNRARLKPVNDYTHEIGTRRIGVRARLVMVPERTVLPADSAQSAFSASHTEVPL